MRAVSDFVNVFASDVSDLFTTVIRRRVLVRFSFMTDLKGFEISDSLLTSPAVILKNDGILMAVVIERELAFILLDTLLGGDGKGVFDNRPFSDVEKAVLSSFSDRFGCCIDFDCFRVSEKNEYFSETGFIHDADKFSVAELDVSWDNSWRKLYLCFPSSSVIADYVSVAVEIGASGIGTDDVSNIGVGDIICISHAAGGLIIRVANKAVFYGKSGLVGDNLAVKITGRCNDDEYEKAVVTALLGSTDMSYADAKSLDVGAVITLDRKRYSPVPVCVSGRPFAEGQVVVVDKKLGVRIKKLL